MKKEMSEIQDRQDTICIIKVRSLLTYKKFVKKDVLQVTFSFLLQERNKSEAEKEELRSQLEGEVFELQSNLKRLQSV